MSRNERKENMDLIAKLTESQLKKDAVNFEVGDTVRVHAKIKEGNRERIQVFEGTVIAMKHGGIQEASPCAAYPTALVWKRLSPSTPPTWKKWKWSARAKSEEPSFTTCVTELARLLKSNRISKRMQGRNHSVPLLFVHRGWPAGHAERA